MGLPGHVEIPRDRPFLTTDQKVGGSNPFGRAIRRADVMCRDKVRMCLGTSFTVWFAVGSFCRVELAFS